MTLLTVAVTSLRELGRRRVALLFVFVNLAVDVLYAVLDPRIRYNG